ncbi:serine hydrolase [Emticicia sp. BO119]|uniref:serine hydrolase domain-containing protein n=1 Tax=Emticicia sp. BO119 TaxID=2757768 RepID=UPI0015F11B9B|nr:serine hydrolase domain-containing protein [Emticicia sp. BO119]MBA4849431.1 beta-lactamase family protein [Emticicia sp. BO119]
MKNYYLTLQILFCLFPLNTFANDSLNHRINPYLDKVEDWGNAGQILITRNGNNLYNRNYGYANREKEIPVTDNTIFEIASASKFFTACAIMKLSEDNKLNLKDSLSQYYPSVSVDKAGITIHQLLTHTSGIRGGDIVDDFQAISRSDLIDKILNTALLAKPKTRFIYSNAGYNLLAALIEKVTGLNYYDYLSKTFFEPLKMKHTFTNGHKKLLNEQVAIGYRGIQNNGGPDRPDFNARTWGGGSICSTTNDLKLFLEAIQKGEIISNESWVKLTTRHIKIAKDNNYGYGCFPYTLNNRNIIDIIGSTERGFNSTIRIYTDTHITYYFLSNASQPMGTFDRVFVDPRMRHFIYENDQIKMPPNTRKLPLKLKKELKGAYTFQDDTLDCLSQGNVINIKAKGQTAINLLLNYSATRATKIQNLEPYIKAYLNDFTNTDTVGFKMVLSKEQIPSYMAEKNMMLENNGKLLNYSLKGCHFDTDTNFVASQIEMNFEKQKLNYFILWNISGEKPSIDFSEPDAPVTNYALKFVLTDDNLFSSYDFVKAQINSILNINEKQLRNPKNDLVFKKVKSRT